jgi:lysophospholipid acyltransferase (LPLAT)-like uncharacterized protein
MPTSPGFRGTYLYTFWHENMLLPAHHFGGYNIHVLISKHADGQLIAETIHRLGFHTVRGSSSRGGIEAAREILKLGQTCQVVITPDGPRGPRRQFQPGAIYLASRTGLPLIPVGIAFDRPWRFKSWDRFAMPKPFRRAILTSTDPIAVPRDADKDTLERYRLLMQSKMDYASECAELLAAGEKIELKVAA